MQSTLTEVK